MASFMAIGLPHPRKMDVCLMFTLSRFLQRLYTLHHFAISHFHATLFTLHAVRILSVSLMRFPFCSSIHRVYQKHHTERRCASQPDRAMLYQVIMFSSLPFATCTHIYMLNVLERENRAHF